MITSLLVGTLAVTWAWEVLRTVDGLLPWSLPSWLLPLLVFFVGLAFCWPDWHLAAACAGAAGIIRACLRPVLDGDSEAVEVRRPGRIPPLP